MENFITKEDLLTLGVNLEEAELSKLLTSLNEEVAALVSEEIVASLTPEDADALATLQDSATDQELGQWISERVPDYPEIIDNNTQIVLGDFIDGNLD